MGMLLYYQFIIVGRRKGKRPCGSCSSSGALPPRSFARRSPEHRQAARPLRARRTAEQSIPGAEEWRSRCSLVRRRCSRFRCSRRPTSSRRRGSRANRGSIEPSPTCRARTRFARRSAMSSGIGNAPINQHQAIVARKLAGEIAGMTIPPRKGAVIILLGRWGNRSTNLPVLLQCLDDPDPIIRKNALMGIGRFQDPRSLAPAVRCLHDPATCSEAREGTALTRPCSGNGDAAAAGAEGRVIASGGAARAKRCWHATEFAGRASRHHGRPSAGALRRRRMPG